MRTLLDTQDEFAEALLSAATPVPSSLKGASVRRADRRLSAGAWVLGSTNRGECRLARAALVGLG